MAVLLRVEEIAKEQGISRGKLLQNAVVAYNIEQWMSKLHYDYSDAWKIGQSSEVFTSDIARRGLR